MPGSHPAFFSDECMLTDRGILIFAQHDDQGIVEVIDDADTRSLYFGTRARQSSMSLRDPIALTLGYTRSMLAALLFRPEPRRVLMIGLGGGSLARFLLHHYPVLEIDCVESRTSVVELARRYFGLPQDARMTIHIGDGTQYVKNCRDRSYDLILIDAFDSSGVHPSVCEKEFHAACHRILGSGGVLSMNLWATPNASLKTVLGNLERGFAGQVLRLPVEQRANLIALGLEQSYTRHELKALREPARKLEQRLALNLPKQLRSLIHYNSALMRRFLDLRSA